jgi:hypothetical protein
MYLRLETRRSRAPAAGASAEAVVVIVHSTDSTVYRRVVCSLFCRYILVK